MSAPCRAAAVAVFCCGLIGLSISSPAPGQEEVPRPPASGPPLPEARLPQFPSTYSPLDAGWDAYERGEQQRRGAIDRQLQLHADLAWYYSLPGYWPYPPGLETVYSGTWGPGLFGPRRAYRYRYPRYGYPTFEPWPFVPGDIYGYPYYGQVPQPLGHKVIRTGPNGYIYRPVYESDLQPKEEPASGEPLAEGPGPALSREPPSARERAPEPVPAPPPEDAPREF